MTRRSPHNAMVFHFDQCYDVVGDCWIWNRGTGSHGYGELQVSQRKTLAHRHSYERTYGTIPDGMVVMHSCDNPRCVNPEHLSVGSQYHNIIDGMNKGRMPQLRKMTDD